MAHTNSINLQSFTLSEASSAPPQNCCGYMNSLNVLNLNNSVELALPMLGCALLDVPEPQALVQVRELASQRLKPSG